MTAESAVEKPNVLFILTDQQRWDTLHVYGNQDVEAPALDALAEDGVAFDSAFCTHPVCVPSRSSILTGLYLHQHGCIDNRSTLSPGFATFPGLLRDAGYHTQAVGKMHLNPTYLDVGFDTLLLAEQDGDGRLDDDYHRELRARGLVDATDLQDQRAEFRRQAPASYWSSFGSAPTNLPERWYSTAWIGDRAVEKLAGWSGGGNLLMVGFVKPHHPFDAPSVWGRRYREDALRVLPGWTASIPDVDRDESRGYFDFSHLTEDRLRRVMTQYYGSITEIDAQIARMLARLRERGLYDNTLIVFTSDHGELLGFHHQMLKSALPYEPLIHVPLLIKFPDSQGAGSMRHDLTSLVDLAPTILRCATVDPAPVMAGHDLAGGGTGRENVFVEGRPGTYVARSRTDLLMLRRDEERSLLFHLPTDPAQLHNLIADPEHRPTARRLRQEVIDWLLFDSPVPPRMDERAAVVRPAARGQREEMLAYLSEAQREVGVSPEPSADVDHREREEVTGHE